MKKEWFFDRFCGQQIVVCAENGKLIDAAVEDEAQGDEVGNIYKGRVMNIVSGMQAAFVSCGMEKNGYLPLLDERAMYIDKYDGEEHKAGTRPLQEGDEILVQVVKAQRGSKGAKLTRDLSFVGKNLIYLPRTDFLGISRKITDEEKRQQLLSEADKLRKTGEGFIIRTAATEASKRHLKLEAEYLRRIYKLTLETAAASPVGTAVYEEHDLPAKIVRDSLGSEVAHIYVGDKELYERVLRLARISPDIDEKKVILYSGERQLFSQFNLNDQLFSLADARVDLESGAYLVVNKTEAMTVIDVNTGSFIGKDDLESTVFETNLLAAKEIARLVRLRDIGGIIAVDFIDMESEEHRFAVSEALASAMQSDRAKTHVYPMNELCVTLFTRKRTRNDLQSFLLKPCPHCTREGYVLSDKFMAMCIRNAIMDCFANGYTAAIVELNRGLMNVILSGHFFTQELRGRWKNKRVYCVPHATWHEEKFTVRGDNNRVLTLPDDAQILY